MAEADADGDDEAVDDADEDGTGEPADGIEPENLEGDEAGEHAGEGEAADDLVARVAAEDEALAAEVGALRDRIDDLEAELADREEAVDELESRLKRTHADFQNYKKRAKEREERLKERATADLVERLLDVRDNLVRALEQDADAEVRDGVEATLATFDRVLESESVDAIEPDPGDEVDPERHEVVMRVEDADQPAGAIEEVYRPGYVQADTVLRPAQVTVSHDPDDG